jgi:hypothetical protein
VTITKLLRKHPVTVPYLLVFVVGIVVLGFHPW